MKGKARKLMRGSMLGTANLFIRMGISLFMTPFMIAHFGDRQYGLWMLAASFTGFYGLFDFGLAGAVQRFFSRSVGTEERDEANTTFNTSLLIFSGLGIVTMLFTLALIGAAPLFIDAQKDIRIFRIVILLAGITMSLGFPMRSFWGVISSYLRYDLSVIIDFGNVIIKTGLIIAALMNGYGIITVAIINLVTDVLWYLTNAWIALHLAPYLRISRKYFNWTHLKNMFNYSMYSFLSQLASSVRGDLDNYVITAFVGLPMVTVYAIGFRLLKYSMSFSGKVVGMLTPVFSQFEGQGNFEAIKEKYFFVTKVSVALGVFVAGMLIGFAAPFIERWVGPGYDKAYWIVVALSIPYMFQIINSPGVQLAYGTSKHKFLALVNVGEAILNLVLSIILVQFYGILGVALGTAIPFIIHKAFIFPVYISKVVGFPVKRFYSLIIGRWLVACAAVFSIMVIVVKISVRESYASIILWGGTAAVYYALAIFFLYFNQRERDMIVRALPWVKEE